MPGMNVPLQQAFYYAITLTLSGAFHEMGHAVAAIKYAFSSSQYTFDSFFSDLIQDISCKKS